MCRTTVTRCHLSYFIPKIAALLHGQSNKPWINFVQKTPLATVYYDKACPLCRAEIKHYSGQTGAENICFIDASTLSERPDADLNKADALRRFYVRKPDGTLVSGAAGFVEIWSILPRWKFAARIAKIPPILFILECGYRVFLPLRPILSKLFGRLTKN